MPREWLRGAGTLKTKNLAKIETHSQELTLTKQLSFVFGVIKHRSAGYEEIACGGVQSQTDES